MTRDSGGPDGHGGSSDLAVEMGRGEIRPEVEKVMFEKVVNRLCYKGGGKPTRTLTWRVSLKPKPVADGGTGHLAMVGKTM